MLPHNALAGQSRFVLALPYGIGAVFAIFVVVAFWTGKKFLEGFLDGLGGQSAEGLVGSLGRAGSLRRGRLRKYRRAVQVNLATHPLGFDGSGAIDIRSRYVPLQYERDGRREDVYARIREEKRSVVTGAPGAGKSLLLKNSMLIWAEGSRVTRQPRDSRRQIPVIVDLHRCNANDGDIPRLITEELARNQVHRADSFAAKALREGRLRLFFDGLDEVGRDRHEHVANMLRDFSRTYPACQMVVTCRDASYYGQLSPEFGHVVRVADFDDASMRQLLSRWPGLGRADVDRLVNTLRSNPPLMRLARSPLLLTMIAYLYVNRFAKTGRTFPASRATFYETAIMHLLGRDRELGTQRIVVSLRRKR